MRTFAYNQLKNRKIEKSKSQKVEKSKNQKNQTAFDTTQVILANTNSKHKQQTQTANTNSKQQTQIANTNSKHK
jgi:hypothetical protein